MGLDWLGNEDKKGHMRAGFLTAFFIALVLSLILNVWLAVFGGIGVAFLVGIAKEVLDYFDRKKHTVDLWDAIATWIGGVLGGGLILIMWGVLWMIIL